MTAIPLEQVRAFRLQSHHLDRPLPLDLLTAAVGACGVQNSPPGTWETAMWNRVEGITLRQLEHALYEEKTVIQAWSIRGVPLIFPVEDADLFLTSLQAWEGEEPWIYTRGITGALDLLGMHFYDLLPLVEKACACLEQETILSKETLDRRLAKLVEPLLPPEVRSLWNAPSPYGQPDRQTVGGAAVSFLLRPCALRKEVVFGRREGIFPTFTAPARWLGDSLPGHPEGTQELVRRFLHCYGPSQISDLQGWLGCSPKQAKRLWNSIAQELEPVEISGKRRWILSKDRDAFSHSEPEELLLLGPHDPYLDLRDRDLVLPDKKLQRLVWKTVGNPGGILLGGRVAGLWTGHIKGNQFSISLTLFEPLAPAKQDRLEELAQTYAAFRQASLHQYTSHFLC